jgi:hypothetical protein
VSVFKFSAHIKPTLQTFAFVEGDKLNAVRAFKQTVFGRSNDPRDRCFGVRGLQSPYHRKRMTTVTDS